MTRLSSYPIKSWPSHPASHSTTSAGTHRPIHASPTSCAVVIIFSYILGFDKTFISNRPSGSRVSQAARAVDCISVLGDGRHLRVRLVSVLLPALGRTIDYHAALYFHHQFCSHSMAQSCLIFLKQAIRQAARAVDCISVQGLHHQFCSHSMAQSCLIFVKQAIR